MLECLLACSNLRDRHFGKSVGGVGFMKTELAHFIMYRLTADKHGNKVPTYSNSVYTDFVGGALS